MVEDLYLIADIRGNTKNNSSWKCKGDSEPHEHNHESQKLE
jgi:hypothetical protein